MSFSSVHFFISFPLVLYSILNRCANMTVCCKNMCVFFDLAKKFFTLVFLIIGFKTGKSSGIGEKIRASKPESGKWKKSEKFMAC
jgi:hypothetical protein